MNRHPYIASVISLASIALAGCGSLPTLPENNVARPAVIVGQMVNSAQAINADAPASCPEAELLLNGAAVDLIFDDECSFLVDNVAPAELVEIEISIASLGLSNTITLETVTEDELIEIMVVVTDDSLSITVVRRAAPDPSDLLPDVICDNNVSIELPAEIYQQNLVVVGNRFTLTGQAAEACSDEGWTVIEGDVLVLGNKATFRNVKFVGTVEVRGNRAAFINCCFDDTLVNFGHMGKKNDAQANDNGYDDDNENDNGGGNGDDLDEYGCPTGRPNHGHGPGGGPGGGKGHDDDDDDD